MNRKMKIKIFILTLIGCIFTIGIIALVLPQKLREHQYTDSGVEIYSEQTLHNSNIAE